MIHPNTSKSRLKKLKAKNSTISAYLIGQLGKNKSIPNNVIDLESILSDVFTVVKKAQNLVGGRVVILECENNEKLIHLYEKQGFQALAIVNGPEEEHQLATMFTCIV